MPQPVDIAIITIGMDEFQAVAARFERRKPLTVGRVAYSRAVVRDRNGVDRTVAIARAASHGEAQRLANTILDELQPLWIFLVGIASAVPSMKYTLGDVILASHVHDFSVSAASSSASSSMTSPLHPEVNKLLAIIPEFGPYLKGWNSEEVIGRAKPSADADPSRFYGPSAWQDKVAKTWKKHFVDGKPNGAPEFHVAAASTNTLVRDLELFQQWRARATAVTEIETGVEAVHHECSARVPLLAIRGLSDIVGYESEEDWTQYACQSAASFAYALIQSGLIGTLKNPRLEQTRTSMILGIIGGAIFGTILFLIGLWRLVYWPVHFWFLWPKPKPILYRFHPVAWDAGCLSPFPFLERLLVAYAETKPAAAEREITRLINSYPSQRKAALRARTILTARRAANETDLRRLKAVVANLPEGIEGYLSQTRELQVKIAPIVFQQELLNHAASPVLREEVANELCEVIKRFAYQIAGFESPLSIEFGKAAENWLAIAEEQLAKARREGGPAAIQVFHAGKPVQRNKNPFVARDNVVLQLEQLLMSPAGCPGLVLYGRRRMGKSTILTNLAAFLPAEARVVGIDCEDPVVFCNRSGLLKQLADRVRAAVGEIDKPNPDNLTELAEFLDACNSVLELRRKRLILMFDEYEQLDTMIGDGTYTCDLLMTIRHSIQHHSRIAWLFAGGHEAGELPNCDWTRYLNNLRTVEVPPFTAEETHLLLTDPLKYARDATEHARKRAEIYRVGFWTESGLKRIHDETAGWPYFVQLLASLVVDFINNSTKTVVTPEILDKSIDRAVEEAEMQLFQIARRECRDGERSPEWQYLLGFRRSDTQPLPADEEVLRLLKRRLLVVEEAGECRMRVPLMQRWLRKNY